MARTFKVGDEVEWTSQAGSYATKKRGHVVAIAPKYAIGTGRGGLHNWVPTDGKPRRLMFDGMMRSTKTYLVEVAPPGKGMPKLYAPRTAGLKIVPTPTRGKKGGR